MFWFFNFGKFCRFLQAITVSQETIFNNLLCCPALLPQITGLLNPEVPDTTNESVQTPPLTSALEDGPAVWKVSKSRRTAQTVDAH